MDWNDVSGCPGDHQKCCVWKDQKWIGTSNITDDQKLFANTAQLCQKFCSDSYNSSTVPTDQKCCFFNWDYNSGDCTVFSSSDTVVYKTDYPIYSQYVSGGWTCATEHQGSCPALIDQIQQQNLKTQKSTSSLRNLSILSKRPKFDHQSKHFQSSLIKKYLIVPYGFYVPFYIIDY